MTDHHLVFITTRTSLTAAACGRMSRIWAGVSISVGARRLSGRATRARSGPPRLAALARADAPVHEALVVLAVPGVLRLAGHAVHADLPQAAEKKPTAQATQAPFVMP